MEQSKNSRKSRKAQKSLIPGSPQFLAAMTKVLFLEGRLSTILHLQTTLRFLRHFLVSSDPKSRVQSLFCQKLRLTLILVNQNYTKILHCFIILFPQLSKKKFILLCRPLIII